MSVIAYSENRDLAEEIFTAALDLANQLGCEASSVHLDDLESIQVNGKIILLKSDKHLNRHPELTITALSKFALERKPSVILIGATRLGRQIASQMAVRMKVGALSEVRSLKIEKEKLMGIRTVYAGKFSAIVAAPIPCIATVPAGAYERKTGPPTSIETISIDRISEKTMHIETKPKTKGSTDIKAASIIISAGRGFKKKEDLVMLEQLAKAMSGAVGCSRPLSADLGWLGEEHHIGLTGAYVHPNLYVAVGISGQLQHIAGIKDSKIIVAINKDKQAPIFQVADYGIVGDLYEVIPALLKHLA
ncbi:MAG TPA: electron transfer flavoprotein subunit alpha/FixB family protein [Candidatus Bathyarchaeia archaeon]|nr:electron transfer flavoprotein subunit alpha/FixB family protein [Candidatus Bathyarchaeia archaeon]